jgi:TP901 family phage tail tape measure protein
MATDKLSVDLLLNTRKAERELAKLNKEFEKLGKTMGGAFGGPGKGGDKVRALGTGLSKATVRADEFTKSLEASNARVVAFGASAGIIMQIDRAFKGLVTSTMKVEKALLDVNVVLNASTKQLKVFGAEMFKIARGTAQSFEAVAEATTELARQGLGTEKALQRTNDALILTRLTGMNAADSVKSLTAAVNSFNKEGVTSAQVINRMAKVDAAFAVSSEDLAKSISRVGASAISAGVSLNELMAITTAVQQKTARGGAVIGNAFKTIFTRIQRTDVLQKLRNIGVAVTDMNGNMLSGMQVIQNLANNFDKLSKSQQASVSESVAGVFQVNILKAAMSDLSSATSHYKGALNAANSATDEAYKRNEQLNQSLDALANRTLANLTQAGAAIGGGTLEPAIKRVLNIVNTSMESFGKGGLMEGFGQTWGKGIMKGLGDFIAGPGLVLVVATIGKLFFNLTKFTGKAFADIMGINKAAQQRVTIEGAIVDTLSKEPALLSSILSGDTKILTVEQQILATIRKQNIERQAMQIMAAPIAASMMGQGLHVGRSGGMSFKGGGRAGGFVPNFADAGSERAAAAAGGYQAGSIRTMNQPGAGTMMYNSAETVKRFPGMSQSAIMPPQGSPAGAGYKSAFGAAHGFDPYAASGFVPNFAAIPGLMRMNKGKSGEVTRGASMYGKGKTNSKAAKDRAYKMGGDLSVINGMEGGISMLVPDGRPQEVGSFIQGTGTYKNFRASVPIRSYDKEFIAEKMPKGPKDIIETMKSAAAGVTMKFASSIDPPARGITRQEVVAALDSTKGAKGALTAAAGAGFEVGMNLALDAKAAAEENKIGDFDVRGDQAAKTHRIFGGSYGIADYKASRSSGNRSSMANKMAKELVEGGAGSQFILHKPKKDPNAATLRKFGPRGLGFVPNFSPLLSAVGREMSAGVPASAIRVGSSGSLKSSGNPGGVGVYNTIHEPGGLQQGISRSRAGGINPKGHGASAGFVPNFVGPDFMKEMATRTASSSRAVPGLPSNLLMGNVNKQLKGLEKGLASVTKASKTAAQATTVVAAETKGFGKSMKGMLGGGKALGLGMLMPMVIGGLQQSTGWGTKGGAGGAIAGGVSTAAMWGGTGAMVHPAVGAVAAVIGGIWGAINGFEDKTKEVTQTVDDLTKKMDELSKRDSRAAETFGRIAEELDKINKGAPSPGRRTAVEKQRNELTTFFKEEYGEKGVIKGRYAPLADRIGKATTGEEVRNIRQEAGKIYSENTVINSLIKGLKSFEAESVKVLKITQGGTLRDPGATSGGLGHRTFQEGILDINSPEAKRLQASGPISNVLATDMGDAQRDLMANLQIMKDNPLDADSSTFAVKQHARMVRANVGHRETIKRIKAQAGGAFSGKFEESTRGSIAGISDLILGQKYRQSGQSFVQEVAGGAGFFGKSTKAHAGRKLDFSVYDKNLAMSEAITRTEGLAGALAAAPEGWVPEDKRNLHMDALATQIAKLSGLDETGTAKLTMQIWDEAKAAAAADGRGGFTQMDALKELGEVALASATDMGALDDAVKDRNAAEKHRLAAIIKEIDLQDARVKAFQTEIGLLDKLSKATIEASAGLRHTAAMSKIQTAFNNKMVGLSGRGVVSRMGARGDAYDVAQARRNASQATESVRYTGAKTDAEAAFTKSVGELQLKGISSTVGDIFKEALKGDVGLSAEVIAARRKDVQDIGMGLEGNLGRLSPDDILKLEQTLKNFGGLAAGEGGEKSLKLSDAQKDRLTSAQKILASFRKLNADYENQQLQLKQQNENNKKHIEETLKLNNQEIDLRFEFNKKARDLVDKIASSQARQQAAEAKDRMRSGKITGAEGAALYKNELERRRTSEGLGPMGMEQGASFRQGFKGAMTYNPRDYLNELEDGSRQVAMTMKTSFADAFKSIASGASSAEEAMAQFAGNILNTISDMSAKMATNMLFSKMGFPTNAQGGYIDKYAGGGVVTGGSGTKDDVLSMMNAGEYVIKKSSAKKIGYDTLNAINSGGVSGFAEGGAQAGGGSMGKMFAVSAAASAASGVISGQWGKSKKKPWRGQDYGHGRGEYGYFGGPDSDAGGRDSIAGGGRGAQVSLNKAYVYYRRDPETGKLVSERVRPTEGKYEVSGALSLLGRLNADDRQTGRMFGKEQKMGAYSDYLFGETERRKDVMKAHKKQKKGRLISAYMNAAMLIGGSYMMGKTGPAAGKGGSGFTMDKVGSTGMPDWALAGGEIPASSYGAHFGPNAGAFETGDGSIRGVNNKWKDPWRGATGGSVGGSPALLTGGEYVMGADTVRQYGLDFMGELNRGSIPGMANGGPVSRGNQGAIAGMVSGGETNNNVNISINVDKRGNVEAKAAQGPDTEDNSSRENTVKDAENNKELGKALQSVVLQELIRQQRPGGLLRN